MALTSSVQLSSHVDPGGVNASLGGVGTLSASGAPFLNITRSSSVQLVSTVGPQAGGAAPTTRSSTVQLVSTVSADGGGRQGSVSLTSFVRQPPIRWTRPDGTRTRLVPQYTDAAGVTHRLAVRLPGDNHDYRPGGQVGANPTPQYPANRNFGPVGSYWPDATTSGIPADAFPLKPHVAGIRYTTADGELIDREDIDVLVVLHRNVICQRSKIRGLAVVPAGNTSNLILVDCTNSNVRNFVLQDSEVYCQTPNEWSVGIDGHDWTRLRCRFHDLQDGARYRNRSSTEGCFIVSRWNWTYDFSYFFTTRAASGQVHCDANQLAGAIAAIIEGDRMSGYFGPNGQVQPTLTTNTSTAYLPLKSNTTAPELAGLMLNNESGSNRKVSGLVFRKNLLEGFVTPTNMGDDLLAGANIGALTENLVTSDSPANGFDPPKYFRRKATQTVDFGSGDPLRCNRYADGPKAGQEVLTRADA